MKVCDMTFRELSEQIERLTLDEQLRLMELLSRRIRASLKDVGIERARGLLATDQSTPSVKDVENACVEYIDEKYR